MAFANPTWRLPATRNRGPIHVSLLGARGEGAQREVRYVVLESTASPVWVFAASLKPWIVEGEPCS